MNVLGAFLLTCFSDAEVAANSGGRGGNAAALWADAGEKGGREGINKIFQTFQIPYPDSAFTSRLISHFNFFLPAFNMDNGGFSSHSRISYWNAREIVKTEKLS